MCWRVLLVLETSGGGAGRHVIDLARGLSDRGHEVHVVYSGTRIEQRFANEIRTAARLQHTRINMRRAPHPSDLLAIKCFYALDEALEELRAQGGWRARHESYRELADQVREGLQSLRIRPLLRREDASVVLNVFHLPYGLSYEDFHDRLKEDGLVIYAGQGTLAKSIFRVYTMGAIHA
jgi:aspartate aminotransferase-like enzyme